MTWEDWIFNQAPSVAILIAVLYAIHKGWMYTGKAFGLMETMANGYKSERDALTDKLEETSLKMQENAAIEREALIAEIAALREQIRRTEEIRQ